MTIESLEAADIAEGERRIEWAARNMPVLRTIRERLAREGTLAGIRVGVSLVLEPKTANLILALKDSGAEVIVNGRGRSTTASTVAALRARGIKVFADATADGARDQELMREFLQMEPQILVDDGASVIRAAHAEFPELVDRMIGACEETTSGVRPLRMMQRDGALKLPVIAVNDAKSKFLFDNVYGTGQSSVMAMLDITNMQIAGRIVTVVGYGWVGKGVAKVAAAMGARVTVVEIDPIKALQAHYDGFKVKSLVDAAPSTEVLITCTGVAGAVTAEGVELLADGAVICTAGGGAFELPMSWLAEVGEATSVREAVTEYRMPSGRTVLVLGNGACINCSDAEGNPIEVMDLSLALQALAVELLVTTAHKLTPGVHTLPVESETEVARVFLEACGATLEPLSDSLIKSMSSWAKEPTNVQSTHA